MKKGKVTFKTYTMAQPSLIPPSWDELIPAEHLVRVVNAVIDKINLKPLVEQYKGGGTSSYHPRMMLKVIVYAYAEKVYSSRKIAKALRENVNFMWLSGGNQPDFRTLNGFRSGRLKEAVREVFTEVLELLLEGGYVKMENYFVDGTKIGANANAHKVVWAKKTKRYKERLQGQIAALLDEIEQTNEQENQEYGEADLEELGGNGNLKVEQVEQKVERLNERLKQEPHATRWTLQKAIKKLEKEDLPRLKKYEEQERVLAGRNSYSKTDPDASNLRLKEDRAAQKPLARPAYNVQIGTENQFITGYSVHQEAGDTTCFVPHMEKQTFPKGLKPKNGSGDAGYGSEENYAWLERHGVENYLKYNTFHTEQHPPRKAELVQKVRFLSTHFPYDAQKDEFTCPAQHPLTYRQTKSYKTSNGYLSQRRYYECDHCASCPLKPQCTKAKGNRRIQYRPELHRYRQQARLNLTSEQGIALRKKRSTEPETVFGDIKFNRAFRRFSLRGLPKVEAEWGILSLAHNMRKLAAQ
jgi:transposase